MSKIFISHSSANNAAALALAQWLGESGWTDYFLDISPLRGLAPGDRWQEALKSAANRCEAVLFLISPLWQASPWCLAELLFAKQFNKPIFGVLVEDTPLYTLRAELTAEWQLCDLVSGVARRSFHVSHDPIVSETEISFAEEGLARLRFGLQKVGLDAASFPWPPKSDPDRVPYRGLKALEPEDAAVFFGREASIVRGLDRLRALRERGIERLFVILGASGAGKSSYLRAGMWPRLARDDRHFVPLPIIRPERAVISGGTGLAASLEAAFREQKATRSRAAINQALRAPGGFDALLAEFQTLARSRLEAGAPAPTLVIAIDQGEELFGTDGRAEAERFLDLLAQMLASPAGEESRALAPRQRSLVVVAIRSDSYERLQTEPRLSRVSSSLFSLPPIPPAEFKDVIEGPAARASEAGHKLTVDPSLTEMLVHDAEGADALPLLAFTLERLYLEFGGSGRLRQDDYDALGGVRGSIEAAVEAAFSDPATPADKQERERLLRAGFIPWLARIDPDTEERKRRVARWEEIPAEARPLLERLVEQRLLLRDRRKLESGQEAVVVEVAHEALLRQWPTLTAWLDQDAAALKVLDAVKRAADEWAKNKQESSAREAWLIHAGERLVDAEALRRRPDFERLLGGNGQAYLDACRAREERVRQEREDQAKRIAEQQAQVAEEQSRTGRAQRRAKTLLLAIAGILVAAGAWIVNETWAVSRQKAQALHERGQAAYFLGDVQTAELLFASAIQIRDRFKSREGYLEAHSKGIELSSKFETRLTAPQISFDTSGELIVLGAKERKAFLGRCYENACKELQYVSDIAEDKAIQAAFSKDGGQVILTNGTGNVLLLSREGKRLVKQPIPVCDAADQVMAVACSKNGARFAASCEKERSVRVWDGERLVEINKVGSDENPVYKDPVLGLAFTAGSDRVASASRDRSVKVWSVEKSHGPPTSFDQHDDVVLAVAFSPADDLIASGGKDLTVHVRDLRSGEYRTFPGHDGGASTLAFSPDGKRMSVGTRDGLVKVWDIASGRLEFVLSGFAKGIVSIAYKGNSRVAAASEDGQVRVWEIPTRSKEVTTLAEHQGAVNAAAFSPDGDWLASSGQDKRVLLWKRDSGGSYEKPKVHQLDANVVWVTFSPDGSRLAASTEDGEIRVWQPPDADQGASIRTGGGAVWGIAFANGGRLIASDANGCLNVWNSDLRLEPTSPRCEHRSIANSIAVSTDGRTMATGHRDGAVIIWDMTSLRPLDMVKHGGTVWGVVFAEKGKRLVSGSEDGTIRLWSIESTIGSQKFGKDKVKTLRGHRGEVWSVAVSRDGLVASGGSDGTVRFWGIDGDHDLTLRDRNYTASSVGFSPGGSLLAVAGLDHQVRVWNVHELRQALTRAGDLLVKEAEKRTGMTIQDLNIEDNTTIWRLVLDSIGTWSGFSPKSRRVPLDEGADKTVTKGEE